MSTADEFWCGIERNVDDHAVWVRFVLAMKKTAEFHIDLVPIKERHSGAASFVREISEMLSRSRRILRMSELYFHSKIVPHSFAHFSFDMDSYIGILPASAA